MLSAKALGESVYPFFIQHCNLTTADVEAARQGGSAHDARLSGGRRVKLWEALQLRRLFEAPRPLQLLQALPLTAMMCLFVVRFASAAVDFLNSYQQQAYDFSLYDQGIWLMSRFHAPFMTVMGTDMFAAHTVFIFALLVPLYWVYPHAAVLLVLQAVALALGAVPVYLLAKRLLRNAAMATLLAGVYLLNPAIERGNLEQFHVEAFEAPLLGFAIYAVVAWKPKLLIAMVALLLMCKQDDALYVVPLGLWVLFSKDKRVGAGIAGAAIVTGLVENLVIIPALLNGVPTTYGGWWPFGSFSATLRTLLRNPGEFASYATSGGRLFYLWQMSFSAGLAFLGAPAVLLVSLPELLADTLANNPYLQQIYRHYSMPVEAVLVCASIYALARLRRQLFRWSATAVVVLFALWACLLWGDLPFSNNPALPPNPSAPSVTGIRLLLKMIPPNAVLSVAENFAPNLDHRVQIYLFPTPFAQSYYGNPANNGKRLPFASQVQYLVLPTCLPCDANMGQSSQQVFNEISAQFRQIGERDGVSVYKRINR
jgi:uncharacterized membrane protein